MGQCSRKFHVLLSLVSMVVAIGALVPVALAQGEAPAPTQAAPPEPPPQKLTLVQATMCERVENLNPINPALVFSVSIGQVCCFTAFDPVPQPTQIFHRWFHEDKLSTQARLRLYPSRWATYSVIQLRETDKGPWRVEVTDQNGRVFSTLRFSIVD